MTDIEATVDTLARLDDARYFQAAQRIPGGGSPDSPTLGEFALAWQAITGLELAIHQLLANAVAKRLEAAPNAHRLEDGVSHRLIPCSLFSALHISLVQP
jgi:hypothetical protein